MSGGNGGLSPFPIFFKVFFKLNSDKEEVYTVLIELIGPFKWMVVQWTAYVTLIWSAQIDDGPMDHLYYVNFDRPNGRPFYGPLMLR